MTSASQIASPRLVPVGDLHPWDENPHTISPGRFENLRRAIAADPEFLRLRPVLARTDGTIYCGNQRYLAAVANGATAVLEDVDERTMRERAIRDNEQWGDWSDGRALVLRSLEGAGSDLSLLGLEREGPDMLRPRERRPPRIRWRAICVTPELLVIEAEPLRNQPVGLSSFFGNLGPLPRTKRTAVFATAALYARDECLMCENH